VGYGHSNSTTVTLPLVHPIAGAPAGTYNAWVDWGDGSSSIVTSYNDPDRAHTYASSGTYEIKIYGQLDGWANFYDPNTSWTVVRDSEKITNISQWGILKLPNDIKYHFYGCTNLTCTATDAPAYIGNTLNECFKTCPVFNGVLNQWDVSNVTDLYGMFSYATTFNQPLSSWNTSSVTTMANMFQGTTYQSEYHEFNQDIGSWNVQNVKDFGSMFEASKFDNGGSDSIGNWVFSSLYTWDELLAMYGGSLYSAEFQLSYRGLGGMFKSSQAFNRNISSWNPYRSAGFKHMFYYATAFNNGGSSGINNWNTSGAYSMEYALYHATAFNQPIGGWDLNGVTSIKYMLSGATTFNQNLSAWDISTITEANRWCDDLNFSQANYDAIYSAFSTNSEVWGELNDINIV
jgi:surface protein